MKTFQDFINDGIQVVDEVFPWDLQDVMENKKQATLLLDIREPYEFKTLHIKGSRNIPCGILELTCDYGHNDTVPEVASARDKDIIVICRSGNRSVLAAHTMQQMGYQSVKFLKTGVKGWNDYDLPLQNIYGQIVDIDKADTILASNIKPKQTAQDNLR